MFVKQALELIKKYLREHTAIVMERSKLFLIMANTIKLISHHPGNRKACGF